MSIVNIAKEAVDTFKAGNGTVGTTPQKLATINWPALKHIVVAAAAANGNTITVGSSAGETTTGFILAAGEKTPPIYVDGTDRIWVVGGAAAQAYNWLAN